VGQESNQFRKPEQAELSQMMKEGSYFLRTTFNAVLLNRHLSGEAVVRLYVDRAWSLVLAARAATEAAKELKNLEKLSKIAETKRVFGPKGR
jgi:hypothetical protein